MTTSVLDQVISVIESAIPMSHIVVYDPNTEFINIKHGTKLSLSEKESNIPISLFHLIESSLRTRVHDDLERSKRFIEINKEETLDTMLNEITRRFDDRISVHQKRVRKQRIYFNQLMRHSDISRMRDILLNIFVMDCERKINDKAMMAMCRALHDKYRG
jgi:hypothetical protein